MGRFISGGLDWMRGRVSALAEPARDPGTMYSSPLEPHLESLGRLKEARLEVRGAIDRLMEMAERARATLEKIEDVSSGASDYRDMPRHYALELKIEISDELNTLDRKIHGLEDEHESLLLSERRLITSLRRGAVTREIDDATSASRNAREAAERSLAGFGTGLHRLDRAIDRARAMGRRLESRTEATGRIAAMEGETAESTSFAERQALSLVSRFSSAIETASNDGRSVPLERGLRAGKGLLYEHQQLKSLLNRSDIRERRSCSKLAILNESVCRHGLTGLNEAYGMTLTMPDNVSGENEDEIWAAVEQQLSLVERCERSIREARLGLLEAGDEVTDDDLVNSSETLSEAASKFPNGQSEVGFTPDR